MQFPPDYIALHCWTYQRALDISAKIRHFSKDSTFRPRFDISVKIRHFSQDSTFQRSFLLRWKAVFMTNQFPFSLSCPTCLWNIVMDRFVIRSASPVTVTDSPPSKRAKPNPKQGKVSAKQRAASHPRFFYCSGSTLFCRPCNVAVDHVRKSTIDDHLASKVVKFYVWLFSLAYNSLHILIQNLLPLLNYVCW